MANKIENRVEKAGLLTLDINKFFVPGKRESVDISKFIGDELIVRESLFKKNIDAGFDRLGIDKSTLPKNHFESIESLMEVEAEAEEEARRLSKKYNLVNKIKKISKLQKKKNKKNKKKED